MHTPATSFLSSEAVEVAALLGDSVVDVKHCVDPRGGKLSSATWGAFAAGGVSLLSSIAAFAVSVHNAAVNKAALATWVTDLKRPANAFRPRVLGFGYDWIAFGGFAIALAMIAYALVRMRREQRTPSYTIGTAPGVDMPLDHVGAHALVAPRGDGFVFNGAPGMQAELLTDGGATPIASAIEIPANARIRARMGNTTFMVAATARPRAQAPAVFGGEGRFVKYAGGSAIAHLAIWALLNQIPPDSSGAALALDATEDTGMRYASIAHDTVPDKQESTDGDGDGEKSAAGAQAPGLTGMAGNPKEASEHGGVQIKNNDAPPQLSREQALQAAREAGVLGSAELRESIAALQGTSDMSSGFSEMNSMGPEFGAYGNGYGTFGMGRTGFNMGGGCDSGGGCGLIGAGRYGTIGVGNGVGDGYGGAGGHGGLRRHTPGVPSVIIGAPNPVGDLDKAIIKRYVKRQQDKVTYCYEKQLMVKPGLAGDVMVQFVIQGDGSVKAANGSGMDASVASCVAEVVGAISFPRPKDGGVVQVNYPFTFHPAG